MIATVRALLRRAVLTALMTNRPRWKPLLARSVEPFDNGPFPIPFSSRYGEIKNYQPTDDDLARCDEVMSWIETYASVSPSCRYNAEIFIAWAIGIQPSLIRARLEKRARRSLHAQALYRRTYAVVSTIHAAYADVIPVAVYAASRFGGNQNPERLDHDIAPLTASEHEAGIPAEIAAQSHPKALAPSTMRDVRLYQRNAQRLHRRAPKPLPARGEVGAPRRTDA